MAAPGSIGAYRIERLLGAGSFATVWLGHDAVLGARVAVKVLAENWSHDLRVRERFLQEARLLWRLDHERLVRVYAVGELPDGRPYSVMDWADGGSLRDRLAAGPVPVDTALWLLSEIAAGAAVLHADEIVHRDLTPGNVLFRSRRPVTGGAGPERVLIADLGLAKALAAASGLTARAGTPGYMAPEQDDPLAVVDVRADVYGLGRLGMRLLCVRDRAGHDMRDLLRPGVPAQVAEVLDRATAVSAEDRFPDAAAFGEALQQSVGRVVAAPPPPRPVQPGPVQPGPVQPGPAHSRQAQSGTRRGGPERGRSAQLAVLRLGSLAATAAVVLATVATDAAPRPLPFATDSARRITVMLPDGWRSSGAGWRGQVGNDGRLASALVVSKDPGQWPDDPTVPGAFVGLLTGGATGAADAFVAAQPHARCTAAPVRRTRQGGVDWVVARFACPSGTPVIVEAAGTPPGTAGLFYVQIAPPAGSTDAFVDTLLAGVRLRPAR
jgi:tRNA A-37 threonylcarbamoyl transferase component Bud32